MNIAPTLLSGTSLLPGSLPSESAIQPFGVATTSALRQGWMVKWIVLCVQGMTKKTRVMSSSTLHREKRQKQERDFHE
jgi:hypothetical protein